ncbi:MAG: zinc metallopeptidase [bacterium]
MFFYDPTIIILLPALLLALYAQGKVQSTFSKYSKKRSARGVTGKEAATMILRSQGIDDVEVFRAGGVLSDHYNPLNKKLFLSEPVYSSDSLAALGVAAHEVGHAIQDKFNYIPIKIRSVIVPAVSLGSNLAIPLFIFGLILGIPYLVNLGIILFSGVVLFHFVTLPVEFDASRRALKALSDTGILTEYEIDGAKKVLSAAALTYIAAALMSILQLLRLIIISRRR